METESNDLPLVGRSTNAVSRVGGRAAMIPPPETLCVSTSPRGGGYDVVRTARGWIGTPYVHQASVKGVGCDCLGLLRGVWRELRGTEPEPMPNYSPDWAEATGAETLYMALARILRPVALQDIVPGDVALFRMRLRSPAKHCGVVADRKGMRTLIHARQNKRVSEEPFSPLWRKKLAYAFRL
jgi:NlpC/P60 family putative phage cell wall peptidase